MTTRVHSVQVVLERDIREDDVEPLLNAIAQLKGVLRVVPAESTSVSIMAEERAKHELIQRLFDLINDFRR